MDLKPSVDYSQLASARTLNSVRAHIALPPPLYSRLFSVPLKGRIHLFGMGAQPGETQHIVLDEAGEVVQGTTLPDTLVEGIAVCLDEIILINGQPKADRLQLIALDEHSAVKWRCELAVAPSEVRYPDVFCPQGQLQAVWVTGTDPAVLWLARVKGRVCASPQSIGLEETTYEVRAIPAGQGLTLTRFRGTKMKPEFIRILNGQIVQQTPIVQAEGAASVQLAPIGDRYALMWLTKSGMELYLQWFDWNLDPLESPEKLVSADGTAKVFSMQFIQSAAGHLLISYIEESDGGEWVATSYQRRSAHYRRRHIYRQFIAPYDWRTVTLASFQQVTPTGLPYNTWSWIGDQLFLVHGSQSPVLSIYQVG